MAGAKEKWLAWIAQNPIQVYMVRAQVKPSGIASKLDVSKQIVYKWLAGESIPSSVRIKALEDAGIATTKDYVRWWEENPNPPTGKRSKSAIDRERIRMLLDEKSELDPETGCKIYCGAWAKKGAALVRIGRRTYSVQMAAMWAAGKLELYDRVYAYRTCKSPACCNLKHIKVANGVGKGMADLRAKGVVVPPKKRGIYLTDQRREAVRILIAEGKTPEQIAADTGVAEHLIKRVAREAVA